MNTGVTASRYAKALLAFVQETGAGEKVYSQVEALVRILEAVPQLRDVIQKHDEIPVERKLDLLAAAVDAPLAMEIVRFVGLVADNHRMEFFHRMLWAFIVQYREAKGIKVGSLVTAVPDEELCKELEDLFCDRTSCEVRLNTSVDPELIGGFIFELDGRRLDASVKSQLDRIRRAIVDESNRII